MKKKLLVCFLSFIVYLPVVFSQQKFQITYDYNPFDVASSVKNTASGYIVAGWTFGFSSPSGLMIQTDLLGTVQWAKTYSGGFFIPLTMVDMQKTAAGGYVTTGARNNRALLMNVSSTGTVNWARGVGNNNDWGNDRVENADHALQHGLVAERKHGFGSSHPGRSAAA